MGTCADLRFSDRVSWTPPNSNKQPMLLGRVVETVRGGVLVEWDNGTESVLRDRHFSRGWARVESDQMSFFGDVAGEL
ncbi:MAG: hypothetical protein AB2L09_02985 [Coriobacteriia bacterium]